MLDAKVVIVEDELIAAEFLKEILEEHGVEVLDTVDTGKEAIEVCSVLKPDVVLMDVMLADGISGSEAAVAAPDGNGKPHGSDDGPEDPSPFYPRAGV